MAPKQANKGGLGHRDAMDFVEELLRGGIGVPEIREQLKASGYSKSRISQLCPLHKTGDTGSASSAAAAPVVAPCAKRHRVKESCPQHQEPSQGRSDMQQGADSSSEDGGPDELVPSSDEASVAALAEDFSSDEESAEEDQGGPDAQDSAESDDMDVQGMTDAMSESATEDADGLSVSAEAASESGDSTMESLFGISEDDTVEGEAVEARVAAEAASEAEDSALDADSDTPAAPAALQPQLQRIRLRGKQPAPAGFEAAYQAPPVPLGPVRRRPAANKKHLCKGLDCRFSTTVSGERGRYQQHSDGFCVWCSPALLAQRCGNPKSRVQLRMPLKFFWEHDKEIFQAAVARLPAEHATLHLVLLVSPIFENAASKDSALGINRRVLVRELRKTLAADEELYTVALAAFPEDKRARLDTQVRSEARQAQRGRQLAGRRAGVSNKAEWQQMLNHRKRSLASPTEEEQEDHDERAAKDREHAATLLPCACQHLEALPRRPDARRIGGRRHPGGSPPGRQRGG
jgi:hypothetical protein